MTTEDPHASLRALTELGGAMGSEEQVQRLVHRYEWATHYCAGRQVVEVACGAGLGLGVLAQVATSVLAGDIVPETVELVRAQVGGRAQVEVFAADSVPVGADSADVIIIFEALYYLPSAERFFREAARVLRPGGLLLIATANKDLADFTPSPLSTEYLGVVELHRELLKAGFAVECFGDVAVSSVSLRQRLLRPLKAIASRTGLVPRTLAGRQWLKRVFFGRLVPLPKEITSDMFTRFSPTPIRAISADRTHKVILCLATLGGK